MSSPGRHMINYGRGPEFPKSCFVWRFDNTGRPVYNIASSCIFGSLGTQRCSDVESKSF